MAFVDRRDASLGSTQFAYQGIVGLGYNIDPSSASTSKAATTARRTRSSTAGTWLTNNNIQRDAEPAVQVRRPGCRRRRRRRRRLPPPSFMVFFDWDRSNLSARR